MILKLYVCIFFYSSILCYVFVVEAETCMFPEYFLFCPLWWLVCVGLWTTHIQTKPKTSRKHVHRSHDNKDITQEDEVAEHTMYHAEIILTRIQLGFQNTKLLDLHFLHSTKYWIQCSNLHESENIPDDGSMWPKHVANVYENMD
jgi:hypothetical protein